MNIIVSGKHIEVTPSLKAYAEEKLARLEHLGFDILTIHVELDVDHHHHKGQVAKASAEVKATAKTFFAHEVASEMHEAIDLLVPKLEHQIDHFKGKLKDSQRPTRV